MRRNKTVVRILLILSVVSFTFARIAQSRPMHEAHADRMTMAEDMTKSSETQHKPLDELLERSTKRSMARHTHPREGGVAESLLADSEKPVEDKFFNQEMKDETKEDMVFTIVVGAVTGLATQLRNGITYPADPGSSTVGRDLIARAFDVSQTLRDHHHDHWQEDLVSRSLSSLRDELLFLSVLSRRMLESLD